MDDIARAELVGGAVEREDSSGGEAGVQAEDGVRAVVAACDGDGAGVEVGVEGVQGGEAGGVGDGGGVQEGG